MDQAATPAPKSTFRTLLHIVYVVLSMSGWRLDHLNIPWVLGGVLSLATGQLLITLDNPVLSISYYLCSLLFYYLGNTLFLMSKMPARLVAKHGEDRAYRVYEITLALMFINQGLGVGCIGALKLGPSWALPGPTTLHLVVGGVFCAIGMVVKTWATVLVGVDVYYYRDMFLNRPVSEFVRSGPYKVFTNPMYGIGQLHAYGIAILLYRSVNGVIAAAICHTLIYVFCFVAEKPFIRRMYLEPAGIRAAAGRYRGALV
jgi:hypothetical protein